MCLFAASNSTNNPNRDVNTCKLYDLFTRAPNLDSTRLIVSHHLHSGWELTNDIISVQVRSAEWSILTPHPS